MPDVSSFLSSVFPRLQPLRLVYKLSAHGSIPDVSGLVPIVFPSSPATQARPVFSQDSSGTGMDSSIGCIHTKYCPKNNAVILMQPPLRLFFCSCLLEWALVTPHLGNAS